MIKNVRFFIEFAIVRSIFFILYLLPLRINSKLGATTFKLFGRLSASHTTALNNCKHVFPNLTNNQINEIVFKSWENLGSTIFELGNLKKIFNNEQLIQTKGIENINFIVTKKKQAIFFSIHHANWEICVPLLDRMDFKVGAIYRHINNHLIDNFVLSNRVNSLKTKNSFYTPKGKKSAKDILEAVKKNNSIFLLVDQKDSAGDDVILFNKSIKTQTGFLKIARKYNLPIVPIENKRLNNGKFLINFHKPIFHKSNDSDLDMMKKIHTIIEQWILNNPNQWFWQHNRFN